MSDTVHVVPDVQRASERDIERATPSRSLSPIVVAVASGFPGCTGRRAGG